MHAVPELSIIIPAINEEEQLPVLLSVLRAQESVSCEVIVVDGGSVDQTIERARAQGVRVLRSRAGRGAQMNSGAQEAASPLLLFLHADSGLSGPEQLRHAIDYYYARVQVLKTDKLAGHFALRFVRHADKNHCVFRYLEAKSSLNRPYTFNGDQGLLIGRKFFNDLGGFDESLPFLEDQRIGRAIHNQGSWITLPGVLTTSARRFEKEGFFARYALMAIIMGAFVADVDEFFEMLPHVYALQNETERLNLNDFLQAIYPVMGKMGFVRSLDAWMEVGRFVRENAWQLFFLVDVLSADNEYNALLAYDRFLEGRLEHPAFDVAAACLTGTVILGVLPALSGYSPVKLSNN